MARPKKNDAPLNELEIDLLEAAKDMLAHSRGELGAEHFRSTTYTVPDNVNVKNIRTSLHLTQEQFANLIGASVHAVRHWDKRPPYS